MKGESKNQKFQRITNKRATDIQNAFLTLARCADTRHFEYNPAEIVSLFEGLETKLAECKFEFTKRLT